jgi:tetratricopeptide (TPR) repeat protein
METDVALRNLIKRVDPTTLPEAASAPAGATVAVDVVVNTDGTVESVDFRFADPSLRAVVARALRQWTFRPFLQNGRAIRVVFLVEIRFADPAAERARKAMDAYEDARTACASAMTSASQTAEAVCAEVVRAAEALGPDRVLERIEALIGHGVSLIGVNRPADALADFKRALALRPSAEAEFDPNAAALLDYIGGTYLRLGDAANALDNLARAVAVLEHVVAESAEKRNQFAPYLKQSLDLMAQAERQLGHEPAAAALEGRAARAASSVQSATPRPPMAVRGGLLCLGQTGYALSEADVRELRSILPLASKPWLLEGDATETIGLPTWSVYVYLEADVVSARLRRGPSVRMAATLASPTAFSARKPWEDRHFQIRWAQVPLDERQGTDVRGHDDQNRPFLMFVGSGSDISDDELIQIVTFVRTSGATPGTVRDADLSMFTEIQPWPISRIARVGDKVSVTLDAGRTVEGPFQDVTLKKTGASWTVVELRPFGR